MSKNLPFYQLTPIFRALENVGKSNLLLKIILCTSEKILKIPSFRARVHSVIWLEYVSVLFDLVGIFGEFICAHTLYFFEKTDVGTGGTTPKRSSTGVFDVTDITLDLNCD